MATSSYEPDIMRIKHLEDNWNEFTEVEYQDILSKLYDNQIDPISNGLNYGQKDIIKHLKKLR